MYLSALAAITLALVSSASVEGPWRAWLDCPGGELPFGIEFSTEDGQLQAVLVNGSERIAVPEATLESSLLVLDMPHYDSRIEAKLEGDLLAGTWRKRRGLDEWTELDFHARRGALPRFHEVDAASTDEVDGRWRVQFASSSDHAVGEFSTTRHGRLVGTFLTTTGDYRYLEGDFAGGELRLSCFDGAHAFLFTARMLEDGSLTGDFWSRDSWHETWSAVRDESVELADAFKQTKWSDGWSIGDVVFPDLEGRPRSLADPEFAGRARILQVFGSWCPNCNDEARYLAELEERYGPRGLSILGLAFELTGDHARDAEQVRRYRERNGVDYPVLIAGTADKAGATRALPALDRVRSYPTTIFLHQDGTVRAVHTGFSGPATGVQYAELREEFEGLIEELLAEPPDDHAEVIDFLDERTFVREFDQEQPNGSFRRVRSGEALAFARSDAGELEVVARGATGAEVAPGADPTVHIAGRNLLYGDRILRVDREADALLDVTDFGTRYVPLTTAGAEKSAPAETELLARIGKAKGVARRERIFEFTKFRMQAGKRGNLQVIGWLDDESLHVELATIWSAGVLGERSVGAQLIERLQDPNAAIRRESVIALGRFGIDDATRPFLEELVEDPDPFVRAAVRRVLARK